MREKISSASLVTAVAGLITLTSAIWWALLAIGMYSNGKGVYFEASLWLKAYRSLPYMCLVPTSVLPFIYVHGGCRNPAIFYCGLTAGLLPLVALLAGL